MRSVWLRSHHTTSACRLSPHADQDSCDVGDLDPRHSAGSARLRCYSRRLVPTSAACDCVRCERSRRGAATETDRRRDGRSGSADDEKGSDPGCHHDGGRVRGEQTGRHRTPSAGLRHSTGSSRSGDAPVGDWRRCDRRHVWRVGAGGERADCRNSGWSHGSPRQPAPGRPGDQVQHSSRRAIAELLGRLELRAGQHPDRLGHPVLDAVSRLDGARSIQPAVALEPESLPVARQG